MRVEWSREMCFHEKMLCVFISASLYSFRERQHFVWHKANVEHRWFGSVRFGSVLCQRNAVPQRRHQTHEASGLYIRSAPLGKGTHVAAIFRHLWSVVATPALVEAT